MSNKPRDQRAEQAIREFGSTALDFAYQAIDIAQVRSEYVRRAQDVSAALRSACQNGEMSAKAAAQAAHEMRNKLLEVQRAPPTRCHALRGAGGCRWPGNVPDRHRYRRLQYCQC